jgi:hypothetical protein
MGRRTTATPQAKQAILDRLSEGEPLAAICRDKTLPSVRVVSDWKAADETFASGFARARDIGHDAIATRLRDTARGAGESSGDVQRDKLIIETDLKLLAKWDKRYGDRTQHDVNLNVTLGAALDGLDD